MNIKEIITEYLVNNGYTGMVVVHRDFLSETQLTAEEALYEWSTFADKHKALCEVVGRLQSALVQGKEG